MTVRLLVRGVASGSVMAAVCLVTSVHAQTTLDDPAGAPVASAAPTERPPVIDGRPDEEEWQRAPVISGFVQHEPFEGRPPTERTEIRILFDNEAVYIAGWMLDRDPSGIVVGETRRDASLRDTDALLIVLDTYHDRQNGFVFGTTPAGIEYDGQVTKEGAGGIAAQRQTVGSGGGFNINWDGSWNVATTVDEDGWYAEFRIPFSTLRYGRGGSQVWGMNISRTIRRRNEEVFWAPIARQLTLYRVSEAGTLHGIEAPTRRTISLTPYALSSAHKDYVAATDANVDAEIGGDAKIGLTPSLTLDLTYNTDFAQVEVDERQINLTRFPLRFPEKRPFFLENAGTFSVGAPALGGPDLGLDLFFSRRIGISEAGTPVPIVGGGRLTGKAGGLTLGLMTLQTEAVAEHAIPANNYSVGRVMRELPNRSRVGAMVVSRLNTDATDDYNLTYSVDGRWGIGKYMDVDAFYARSETPGLENREHALHVGWAYETRDWNLIAQYREVGEDFNAEVGFVPRDNFRMFVGLVDRKIRPAGIPFIREFSPHIAILNWFDFDGFNVTRLIHTEPLPIEFSDGSRTSVTVNLNREGLGEPFEIAEGIVIPTGTYDFPEFIWNFNTNRSAPFSVSGSVGWGEFYSGHKKGISGTISGRSGATLVTSLRLSYDDVDLAEGSFETTLAGLSVAYSFTPRIFLESLIQYSNQDDDLSGNIRFGWLDTAGTGLFLVYNEVRQTVSPTGPQDRTFIVKFTRQLNLLR